MRKVFAPKMFSSSIKRGVNVDVSEGAEDCVGFKEFNGGLKRGVCAYKTLSESGNYIRFPDGVAADYFFAANTSSGERFLAVAKGDLYVSDGSVVSNASSVGSSGSSDGVSSSDGVKDSAGSGSSAASGNSTGEVFKKITGVSFKGKVSFGEVLSGGAKCVLICDENGSGYVYDGLFFTKKSVPKGVCAIVSLGLKTVLVTDKKAYVSKSDESADFSFDSGKNNFSFGVYSGVKNAAGAGGEVVFASDKGLFRLSSSAFGTEFSFKVIDAFGLKIYPSTLAACGEKIFALSDGGLIEYDGAGVTVKYPEICEFIGEGITGFAAKNEYFASFRSALPMKNIVNVCFYAGGYYATGLDITAASARADGSTVFTARGVKDVCSFDGKILCKAGRATYKTNVTDFGISGRKTLAYVKVSANRNFLLTVTSDGARRKYVLKSGANGYVRPYVSGEFFSFEFESEYPDFKIFSPRVEIEYV